MRLISDEIPAVVLIQQLEGQQQVHSQIGIVQIQVGQFHDLTQTVGQGGAVDDQGGGSGGNVPLTQKINPEGIIVLCALGPIVFHQVQQQGMGHHFGRKLCAGALPDVVQGAGGEQNHPVTAVGVADVVQGNVCLNESLPERKYTVNGI